MNKLDTENTIVIVGNSPSLKEYEEYLPYIISRYTSIGINEVVYKIKTPYFAFVDLNMLKLANSLPKEVNIIAVKSLGGAILRDNKELYNFFTFDFNKDKEVFKKDKNGIKMAWCGFTHDFLVSYCIYKNWKNIVLLGVADFVNGGHYSNESKTFKYSETLRDLSLKFLSEVCTKKCNLYKCNLNSNLNVPYINIKELLS